MDNESLSEFFEQYEFDAASPEDIFKVLGTLESTTGGGGGGGGGASSASVLQFNNPRVGPTDHHEPAAAAAAGFLNLKEGGGGGGGGMELQAAAMGDDYSEKKELVMNETNHVAPPLPKSKRQKLSSSSSSFAINNNNNNNNGGGVCSEEGTAAGNGQQKMAHITVERNRRKQMNEHLAILRSLMPCFYVKRGDQASVIGGVVNYINELQQVLQSLEAKKQRKVLSEVLSPRIISPSRLSPRKPPLSPRLLTTLPVSPRTPPSTTTSCSPYKPRLPGALYPPLSPPSSSAATTSSADSVNELVANSKSVVADVEVKFSGANVLVQTVSHRIHGQAVKIIGALENLNLEILQVNITTFEETMICSFTIKIGIECELSADDLAHLVQQTFC